MLILAKQSENVVSDDGKDAEIEKYQRQNTVNKMLLQNQLQIGLTLQKEIEHKQKHIKDDLRIKMGAAVVKSFLLKKKRILQKKYFQKWSGELKYSEALMYSK